MSSSTLTRLCPPKATPPQHHASAQFRQGRFRNHAPRHAQGLLKMLGIMWRFAFNKPAGTVPRREIPVLALSQAELLAAPDASLWRLGHSTMLIKIEGGFWLTDPVFSLRASPLQFLGPKRFHAPPISIDELPAIRGVLLSHDHYDHLDKAAVLALAAKTEHFIAPLGVGETLKGWGLPAAKVRELDWWQNTQVGGLQLHATPAQHFSGRGLRDGNRTLWCSWVLEHADFKLFFSGDSGYFPGFKAIGERHGPFDLSLVETGAYNEDWPDIHMHPEESLQAHIDLDARVMMPMHNGTFDLSLHPWEEPFERITALAQAQDLALTTPLMGERVDIQSPPALQPWWRGVNRP